MLYIVHRDMQVRFAHTRLDQGKGGEEEGEGTKRSEGKQLTHFSDLVCSDLAG